MYNRREAIGHLAAFGLVTGAKLTSFPGISYASDISTREKEIVAEFGPIISRQILPSSTDFDKDKVIAGIKYNGPATGNKYIPDLAKLLQAASQHATGETINGRMKEYFGHQNPIELLFIEDLKIDENYLAGIFKHQRKGSNNFLIIDPNQKYSFTGTMCHELQHGARGSGEAKAYVLQLRDLAATYAVFPELMELDREIDPLIKYIDELEGCIYIKISKDSMKIDDFRIKPEALIFGFLTGAEIMNGSRYKTLEDAVTEVQRFNHRIDQEFFDLSVEGAVYQPETTNALGKHMLTLVVEYIARSTNMSDAQREKLSERLIKSDFTVVHKQ